MKYSILMVTGLLAGILLTGCSQASIDPPILKPSTPETTFASTSTEETVTEGTATATEYTEAMAGTEDSEFSPTEGTQETETSTTEETTCKHSYRSKITKKPTCSSSGEKEFTCSLCGAIYKEILNPLDHAYIKTVKSPDCENSGCTTYRCKECGATYTDNHQPRLGHNFGPQVIVKEPTVYETGLAECVCSRCGKKETIVLPRISPAD